VTGPPERPLHPVRDRRRTRPTTSCERAAGSRATFPRPEGRTRADRLPGRRHASPRV